MMKKPRLQDVLNKSAKGESTLVEVSVPANKAGPLKPRTREGRVNVSGWLPIEARSSLRLIQAKHPDKLMQDMVAEAFNDLFAKYNVPQTARMPTTAIAG